MPASKYIHKELMQIMVFHQRWSSFKDMLLSGDKTVIKSIDILKEAV